MSLFDRFKKDEKKKGANGSAAPPPEEPVKEEAPKRSPLPKASAENVREELGKRIITVTAESRALFAKSLGSAFDGLQRPFIDFRSWRGVEVQLEYLYLYLSLTDRIAQSTLGEEKGVDFSKPLVKQAMTRTLEAVLIDESDPKAHTTLRTKAFADLNAAAEEYAPFEQILPSTPGNYKDSVVGHFGKRLASNLGAVLDGGVMTASSEIARKGLAQLRIEEQMERILE